MKLSTKTRYAARALAQLASAPAERPISARELAECQDISTKYHRSLPQVLAWANRAADGLRAHRVAVAFYMGLLMIAVVSVHDAFLVILNDQVILRTERNPIGCWLIQWYDGEVWLFILAKFFGTAIVCAVLLTLFERRRRTALLVTAGVAAFQGGLLCLLCWG